MRNLLMVAIYVVSPPGRCREYREALLGDVQPDMLELGTRYKTSFTYGDANLPVRSDALKETLILYLKHARPVLAARSKAPGGAPANLFLNDRGAAYSASRWSQKVMDLVEEHAGVRVGVNVLRSSFIVHLYDDDRCTEMLRESVAAAMVRRRSTAARSNALPARTSSSH